MSEGIQETKDVLVALNDVSLQLIAVLKDGPQFSDIPAFMAHIAASDEVKHALFSAYENISMVPSELKDLSIAEGIDLMMIQAQFIPKIVDAFKA